MSLLSCTVLNVIAIHTSRQVGKFVDNTTRNTQLWPFSTTEYFIEILLKAQTKHVKKSRLFLIFSKKNVNEKHATELTRGFN